MSRWLWLFTLVLAGCGGAQGEGAKSPSETADGPKGERVSGDPIAGTPAYDAAGKKHACAPPDPSCASRGNATTDFKDRCQLGGFRLIRCGCEELCTGNIATGGMVYDANNVAKSCAPEQKECTPPDTSAAFQDACTESGHKFVVCGCEWLCSGKLSAPVTAKPAE